MADTVIQPEVEANAGYVAFTASSLLHECSHGSFRDTHCGVDVHSGAWWTSARRRRGSAAAAQEKHLMSFGES